MDLFVNQALYMGLFIITFLSGVLIYNIFESKREQDSHVIIIVIAFILMLVVPNAYFGSVTHNTIKVGEQTLADVINEHEICAVSVGQKLEGTSSSKLILGSGHVDFVLTSNDTYDYYCQDGGQIWRESVPASESYIEYISENETPKIAQYHEYRIETYRYKDEERKTKPLDEKYYYVFYVPEGSVVETFDFN